jgi:hypothetical protein
MQDLGAGDPGIEVAIGAFFTGPSRAAIQTRSGIKLALEWIEHYGERRGVSTGPVGQWTYLHRRACASGRWPSSP